MNIAIIGAGNVGTALAADLAQGNTVKVYSTKPHMFKQKIQYIDEEKERSVISVLDTVSDQYDVVLENADIVFLSIPTFLIRKTVLEIINHIDCQTPVGFVPGAGGIEFLAKELIDNGNPVFGCLRVPYVARLQEYGSIVYASKKDSVRIAAVPNSLAAHIASTVEQLLNIPCEKINNFLSMTLTPTLHTSRLYDLYHDIHAETKLKSDPYFYADWTDSASALCFALDNELHLVAEALEAYGLNMQELIPYKIHYESDTIVALTEKLHSIKSLSNIKGPQMKKEDYYVLDIHSRYFTESYPYRLCIVKGIADLCSIDVPKTDEVLKWYSKLVGKEYYVNNDFSGKDIGECVIPQNFGIDSISDFIKIYQR